MLRDDFIKILTEHNLKPGIDDELHKLIDDFSKPPIGTSIEESKELAPTAKVYKETIRWYVNIFMPNYFKPRAISSIEDAWSTMEDERAKPIRSAL